MSLDYKPLVFIVDDIAKNIQIISNILGSEGFRVSFTLKSKDVLDLTKQNKPDLILLDVMMPECDGYTICNLLKNDIETAHIPVIFVTGKSHSHEINKAFDCGAVDYIVKPFNAKELLNRVKTHVNLKIANDNLQKKNVELKTYQDELKQAIFQKDKFFSIIAHDLRGPFSGFLGLTELLVNEYELLDKDEIIEIASNLNNSAQRLFNLLENLLTWANTQTGKFSFTPDFFMISNRANKIINIYSHVAESKNITVLNNIPDDIEAHTDITAFDTILRNLIGNAIKFTKEGGEVALSSFKTNSNIIKIFVTDNGVGIPDEKVKTIFSVFEKNSTLGTKKESGSGLGLQICKELVEMQGGSIEVNSILGKGTTFAFTVEAAKYN